jgi:hypothetical protein
MEIDAPDAIHQFPFAPPRALYASSNLQKGIHKMATMMSIKPQQIWVDCWTKYSASQVQQEMGCTRGHTAAANNP